jgi:protein-S-isoprenylcysteine O-methyltransferase Ste14
VQLHLLLNDQPYITQGLIMLKLKIPPPIYMLSFAAIMYLVAQNFPVLNLFSEPLKQLAYPFLVVGLIFDLFAVSQFFRSKTTVNPIKPNKTKTIVSTGLYKITRNPMYLGMLLLLIAWSIHLGVLTPFLLLPIFVWVLTIQQIIPEEKILEKNFGESYLNYKQKVRRWI